MGVERVAALRRLLAACDHALQLYRNLAEPPNPKLMSDVEQLRERVAADLRRLKRRD